MRMTPPALWGEPDRHPGDALGLRDHRGRGVEGRGQEGDGVSGLEGRRDDLVGLRVETQRGILVLRGAHVQVHDRTLSETVAALGDPKGPLGGVTSGQWAPDHDAIGPIDGPESVVLMPGEGLLTGALDQDQVLEDHGLFPEKFASERTEGLDGGEGRLGSVAAVGAEPLVQERIQVRTPLGGVGVGVEDLAAAATGVGLEGFGGEEQGLLDLAGEGFPDDGETVGVESLPVCVWQLRPLLSGDLGDPDLAGR